MKKFFRWLIGIILCLLAALFFVWLFKDSILKAYAERRIREQTGLETRIGELKVSFGSARLSVKDFKLLNPPGFGGSALVDLPELFMELDTEAAAAGKLHFKELRFHLAELNLVRNRDGQMNVEVFSTSSRAAAVSSPSDAAPQKQSYQFGGIDKLVLSLGKVRYTDLRQPANSSEIVLGLDNEIVTDLRTEDDLNRWLATLVVRIVLQEYLSNPVKSKAALLELLLSGLRRK